MTTLFDFTKLDGGWNPACPHQAVREDAGETAGEGNQRNLRRYSSQVVFGFESCPVLIRDAGPPSWYRRTLASRSGLANDDFLNILDGTLRILGDFYRYPQEDPDAYPTDDWLDWSSARAGIATLYENAPIWHGVRREFIAGNGSGGNMCCWRTLVFQDRPPALNGPCRNRY